MSYHEHKDKSPQNVQCAVVTISDSRTLATDDSGKIIQQKLISSGHRVTRYSLIKNDVKQIQETITGLVNCSDVQAVITIGGTGIGCRDVTIETLVLMFEKTLDGFGELFRSLTYAQLGTASVMSRAVAGTITGKLVFCLPGSLDAAKLAMDKIILPEIGHLVREAGR